MKRRSEIGTTTIGVSLDVFHAVQAASTALGISTRAFSDYALLAFLERKEDPETLKRWAYEVGVRALQARLGFKPGDKP